MREIKNILIFKSVSQYDVLDEFASEIAVGFRKFGCDVDILDGRVNNIPIEILEKAYDVIFSFYSINRSFIEKLNQNANTLYFMYLVDHPYYRFQWLTSYYNNLIVATIDKKHCEFVKRNYPYIEGVHFIPHGGNICVDNTKEYKDREVGVVFIGSLAEDEYYEELQKNLPPNWLDVVENVVDLLMDGNRQSPDRLLDEVILSRGLELSQEQKYEIYNMFCIADTHIRSMQRKKLIEIMGEAGISIDVYGNGWDRFEKNYDSIRFHGNISYEEAIKVMKNAKIVLNKMPLFAEGSHERVFTSMMCGSVCLTDSNLYLEEIFEDNENICFYDFTDLPGLVRKIKWLLDNTDAAARIAREGQMQAKQKHTWEKRAEQILDICKNASTIDDIEYIAGLTILDKKFNELVNYIYCTDEDILVEKCKKYVLSLIYKEETYRKLEAYHNNQYGRKINESISESISDVKQGLGEYVWLYGMLADVWSRKTLVNLINYRLTYEQRYIEEIYDRRYEKYCDWDILDMREEFKTVVVGDDSTIIAEICKNYNALCTGIDVFVASNYISMRMKNILPENIVQITVCDNNVLKDICLDDVFGEEQRMFVFTNTEYIEEILCSMENFIKKNKPKIVIALDREYANVWRLPNILSQFREDYSYYLRCYDGNIVQDKLVLYVV